MEIIEQSCEVLPEVKQDKESILKRIEYCARVCYNSHDKITPISYFDFTERLKQQKHFAVFEFGTVYLQVPTEDEAVPRLFEYPFSFVVKTFDYYYITTTMRILVENDMTYYLYHIVEPTRFHIRRYTAKLITSRQVMAEITRHRLMSFCCESTRYNKYKTLTFIKPDYAYDDETTLLLGEIEKVYQNNTERGLAPQLNAAILPNCLKTTVMMAGLECDWKYVFKLRTSVADTGKPLPMMERLMNEVKEKMKL